MTRSFADQGAAPINEGGERRRLARCLVASGGAPGPRDEGLLDSALPRPQHLMRYGDPDMADVAAAIAFGLARNHPFRDGNTRTSLAVCLTAPALNGFPLDAEDAETVSV